MSMKFVKMDLGEEANYTQVLNGLSIKVDYYVSIR
ncbi:hypothetical protein YN1HA_6420 [Sulfurisphaera ohwakuensis]